MVTLLLVFLFAAATYGRSLHYNVVDLNDDFYSELRNLLRDHLDRKGAERTTHPQEVRNWPRGHVTFGQVAGVDVDPEGRPVIFHRGPVTWDEGSFNATEHYQGSGPIDEDTVLILDPREGSVLSGWGKGLFYMPHGITLDDQGNFWLTDVGSHQVFKFSPGSTTPSLTLGEPLQPGHDDRHFCQPTDVAVASSGIFYVADGYCNSRILQFAPDGTLLAKFGDEGQFNIPHSLALLENLDLLCVADRENERVACFKAGIAEPSQVGFPAGVVRDEALGRVFAIAPHGKNLFAINGPSFFHEHPVQGFTIDAEKGTLIDTWGPPQGFESPHDIAVSPDGSAVYVTEIGPNRVWKFLLENEDIPMME